jgi:(2Fe-2S) ferredoxin
MAWQPYRPFQIQGVLLSVLGKGKASSQPKRLILEVENALTIVQVGKSLRQSIQQPIEPGSRLQISGIQEVNLTECKSRLLAQEIQPSNGLITQGIAQADASIGNIEIAVPRFEAPRFEASRVEDPRIEGQPLGIRPQKPTRVLICSKSHCWKQGGKDIYRQLSKTIEAAHWENEVKLCKTGCMGHCKAAPNVVIAPAKITLRGTTVQIVVATLQRHIASLFAFRSPEQRDADSIQQRSY